MASDNFNRADESPIAAPWTKVGSGSNFNLTSNALVKGSADDSAYYYSGAATGADQYSEAKQVVKPFNNDWGPAVRITGAAINMYCYDSYVTDEQIFKEVAGVYAGIAHAGNDASVAGDVLRLEASGTTLTAFKNGVQRLSGTDASFSSGQPGIFIFEGGAGVIDDWAGGDLGAPPAPTPKIQNGMIGQAVQRSVSR